MSKLDWKGIVGKFAPTVATALGSPLAGIAIKTVVDALGIKGEPSSYESQIQERLTNATSEDLIKLKDCEANFKLELKRLEIKETDLFLSDVQNARENTKGQHEPFTIFLILSVIAVTGGWYLVENIREMDVSTVAIIMGVYGQVVGKWMDSISYFVGTSKSSKDKNSMLTGAKI